CRWMAPPTPVDPTAVGAQRSSRRSMLGWNDGLRLRGAGDDSEKLMKPVPFLKLAARTGVVPVTARTGPGRMDTSECRSRIKVKCYLQWAILRPRPRRRAGDATAEVLISCRSAAACRRFERLPDSAWLAQETPWPC